MKYKLLGKGSLIVGIGLLTGTVGYVMTGLSNLYVPVVLGTSVSLVVFGALMMDE